MSEGDGARIINLIQTSRGYLEFIYSRMLLTSVETASGITLPYGRDGPRMPCCYYVCSSGGRPNIGKRLLMVESAPQMIAWPQLHSPVFVADTEQESTFGAASHDLISSQTSKLLCDLVSFPCNIARKSLSPNLCSNVLLK